MHYSRREIVKFAASGLIAAAASPALAAVPSNALIMPEKTLRFYNTHTGEHLTTTFWANGHFVKEGLSEIDYILRDHRANEAAEMDPQLALLLHDLQRHVDSQGVIEIISGFRSAKTNASMRAQGRGVARKSYHMLGQAIDIRIPGVDSKHIQNTAIAMKRGGVGYYKSSDFVHLDTGRVRTW